jgi:hypothetical protein
MRPTRFLRRPATAFRPAVEILEGRALPAAVTSVNDNWHFVTDADASNSLTSGDLVSNANDATDPGGIVLAYGVTAFGTVTTGARTGALTDSDNIADAMASTDVGGTVRLLAGTFTENVVVSKRLALVGAGGGTADTVVRPASANTPAIRVTGSGLDADNRLAIRNLRVTGATGAGVTHAGIRIDAPSTGHIELSGLTVTGNAGYGIALNTTTPLTDIAILNSTVSNHGRSGLLVGHAHSLDGLTIANSVFQSNTIGIEVDAVNPGPTYLRNVSVSNTQFLNNVVKAAYIEKLSDATFTDIVVAGNGTGAGPGGIDINLKYGTYSGIAFRGAVFTDNARNTASGTALAIKGRDDAPSYNTNPATLTGVSLTDVTITGSPIDLAFGNRVTGIALSSVTLGGTGGTGLVYYATATDVVDLADTTFESGLTTYVLNTSGNPLDATAATFAGVSAATATTAELFTIEDRITHDVDNGLYALVRVRAGNVFATPSSFTASTLTPSVQRAIDAASAGDTVNVQSGSYPGGADATAGRSVALSAGAGPVTLGGDLKLDGDDTLPVDVHASSHDRWIVNGAITLGGNLVGTGTRTAAAGEVLVLVQNDGADAVNGTFQGLPEGATLTVNGVSYRISYAYNAEAGTAGDGNDVALVDVSAIALAADPSADERGVAGRFVLTRDGDLSVPLAVGYTVGGSAANGVDYQSLSGTVTFAVGSTTAAVAVIPVADTITEGPETVVFTLAPAAAYTLPTAPTATVTIADSGPEVGIAATGPNASESGGRGRFTLTRTDPTGELTVHYTIAGSATGGTDYAALSGQVTFAAGASTAVIDVDALNDTITEGTETVVVTLPAGADYTVTAGATAEVLVADNGPEVSIAVAERGASEAGAVGRFMATRSDPTGPLTVHYTVAGSASAGTDYVALAGAVEFPDGQSSVALDVTPFNDTFGEGAETVTVTLSTGAAYMLGTRVSDSVVIADNGPELAVAATAPAASESGAAGRFTVTRAGATTGALTVLYTMTGSATNGIDYAALSGVVTFAVGSATADIEMTVLNDTAVEGVEAVRVTLRPGAGYTLAADPSAEVSIVDNDVPPSATGSGSPARPGRMNPLVGLAGSLAVGDVNGDGVLDFVTVVVSGGPPLVRVFDGVTGAERLSFFAYPGPALGARIAAGDLNGDGRDELVVATSAFVPAVLVFDGLIGTRLGAFLAYPGAAVGVRIAVGDTDGDGTVEIVACPVGAVPVVSVFDMSGNALNRFLVPAVAPAGAAVSAADLDGDGLAEILVSATTRDTVFVSAYGRDGTLRGVGVLPLGPRDRGAFVPLAIADLNGDGRAELLVAVGSWMGVLDGTGLAVRSLLDLSPDFKDTGFPRSVG